MYLVDIMSYGTLGVTCRNTGIIKPDDKSILMTENSQIQETFLNYEEHNNERNSEIYVLNDRSFEKMIIHSVNIQRRPYCITVEIFRNLLFYKRYRCIILDFRIKIFSPTLPSISLFYIELHFFSVFI